MTALMRAVLRGVPTTAEWLLAAGADPDARADDGKTALDFARDLGRQDLVDLLIAAGATDAAPDIESESPTVDPPLSETPLLSETPPPSETAPTAEIPPSPANAPPLDPAPVTVARRSARPSHEAPYSDRWSDTITDAFDDRFDDRLPAGALR